ncbi:hypothetical protein HJC23_012518 [Cyclotella cryptica]|uniref:Uncharacterized protein n=1 Tax=Cyclotella cryptica TaxID=29204 RepID=A0ABD3QR44_9STRA|eukprot:CCRYP_003133-RA/>CCRYP_003133-RA protein AED:0.38 eAED:1.00 QI:0/0/0/1/1/1/2/0/187
MKIATFLLLLGSVRLSHAQSGIPSPTKGSEVPDDYADAMHKLQKDIGSGGAGRAGPKKFHKKDVNMDEIKGWKHQVDERMKKRKAKAVKWGRLTPKEIAEKTDEELLEMYYEEERGMLAHFDDMYEKVTEALKGESLSREARERHTKKKEMLEKKKKQMEKDGKKRAQMYIDHMRRRAEAMKSRDEL